MQKSTANIGGVLSIVLTSESGPGIVIINDAKRTSLPGTLEKGACFSVYPFGQECGVMISHTRYNRGSVRQLGAAEFDAAADSESDDQILMRASQYFLAQAETACAEFDPSIGDDADPSRLAGPDKERICERLEASREFNRIVGVKLHQKMTSADLKNEQRALANMQRKEQASMTQRQSREKKLVKFIARFRRIPGGPSYIHYLDLQIRGSGDVFAEMTDDSIFHRSAPRHLLEVRRWLGDTPEVASALRWILRGLSPNMAIRKVIADMQERDLAVGALPPAPRVAYTFRLLGARYQ